MLPTDPSTNPSTDPATDPGTDDAIDRPDLGADDRAPIPSAPGDSPRRPLGPFGAYAAGWRRVARAPGLVLVLWLINLSVALPLALAVGGAIESSLGASAVAEDLETGFDMAWYGELEAEASGLVTTFRPAIAGVGAFLENLEAWWSGDLFRQMPPLVAVGLLVALLWVLLSGAVLERLREARVAPSNRRGGAVAGFLADGGRFAGRFLRLAAAMGLVYLGIFRLAWWAFPKLEEATRDVTSERTVFLWVVLGAALVVALLGVVRLVSDLAKVITVLDDRRSVLRAAWDAVRLVVRRPVATIGLALLTVLTWVLLLGVYGLLDPVTGPDGPGGWWGVVLVLVLGQAMLMAKLALRLAFLAGETALVERLEGPGRSS